MNLLGKFFTVLIFLLAAVFMAAALMVNASHRNWRQVVLEGENGAPGLKEQIESLDQINRQLRDESAKVKADLDRERIARVTALASLQTQLDNQSQDLERRTADVSRLTSENTTLAQDNQTNTLQLKQLMEDNDRLEAQIRREQQQRDQLFTEVLEITDKMNQLRGFKTQLEERNKNLQRQVTRFEEVVSSYGINIDDPLDGSPPERNGKVVKIDRDRDLVLISIGYDEGLRDDHTLEVTRNDRYITKLKVVETRPDQAVARIIETHNAGTIQEGDRVDTTLE
ncbi:MAG: hypothetical protein AAF958_15210 [Planctomycetota bacterium]